MEIFYVALLYLLLVSSIQGFSRQNEIVSRILGGPQYVKQLVNEMGFMYRGEVKGFKDTYILVPVEGEFFYHTKRGNIVTKRLVDHNDVVWVEQLEYKKRQKRDFKYKPNIYQPRSNSRRLIEGYYRRPLLEKYNGYFNDELWQQEWYLQDTRTRPNLPKLDLNVLPLYKLGITGKGVRISILDDGLEWTHEDLKDNYDPAISWDCNDEDEDPMPRYEPTKQNSHGTRCAGEVAMTANNGKCGVGIAYNAKIGGVKLLDGLVNDRVEGTALSFAQNLVDIYSASWGPNDDGRTVDGPGRLAKEALENGVTNGRKGLGNIFVWASGNGGNNNDNCNCDGYLASPYTISIGSASQRGEFPWYGEECASTLAVTYSSGAYQDQMIATTDLGNECTIKHTGTSASAPLAAGIIALALEVNPLLNWRDVQHLIVWTSEPDPVFDNPGWKKNAAGLWFNTRFGFGLMNAFGLVKAAANWTTVPKRYTCKTTARFISNNSFSFGKPIHIPIQTTGCDGTADDIKYIEHVETITNINYTKRGSLDIFLISPSGTKVQLLSPRKLDKSKLGFQNWSFMSVMNWGEPAQGIWILKVEDNVGDLGNHGHIGETTLVLHGTKTFPEHMKHGPRYYNQNYNKFKNINEHFDELNDMMNLIDYSNPKYL